MQFCWSTNFHFYLTWHSYNSQKLSPRYWISLLGYILSGSFQTFAHIKILATSLTEIYFGILRFNVFRTDIQVHQAFVLDLTLANLSAMQTWILLPIQTEKCSLVAWKLEICFLWSHLHATIICLHGLSVLPFNFIFLHT